MISNKLESKIIEMGYPANDLKVQVNRKYIYNEPKDANIKISIMLDGLSDLGNMNLFVADCEIIYPSDNLAEKIPDLMAPLLEKEGGRIFLKKQQKKGYILFVQSLWIHPLLNNCEESLKHMMISVISDIAEGIKHYNKENTSSLPAVTIIKANNKPVTEERLYKMGFVVVNTTELFVSTEFANCYDLTETAIEIGALKTENENVLVYREKTETEPEGYKQTPIYDFVQELYVSGVGQLHMLNAVFNN